MKRLSFLFPVCLGTLEGTTFAWTLPALRQTAIRPSQRLPPTLGCGTRLTTSLGYQPVRFRQNPRSLRALSNGSTEADPPADAADVNNVHVNDTVDPNPGNKDGDGNTDSEDDDDDDDDGAAFSDFVAFLRRKQSDIIGQIEQMDGSGRAFTDDRWGAFAYKDGTGGSADKDGSGGITRVLQGGDIVEKGACSFTLIQSAVLSEERAAAIRSRQDIDVQPGDTYSAAALSIVFHTRSPLIPTFRSDVRIFCVGKGKQKVAWLGGGADLTPYYLFDSDVSDFHRFYKDLCKDNPTEYSYDRLKEQCDAYFYLPARSEHRGTGGIFFDDWTVTEQSLSFAMSVADAWMPSWLPIVERRRNLDFSDDQKRWQLIRRGRYLEFNLLYDRGVKFGLANANPRVEGVMVSAPPMIAWEYNFNVREGSEEARLVDVLKRPRDWAS